MSTVGRPKKVLLSVEFKYCECECGETISKYPIENDNHVRRDKPENRYKKGHENRGRKHTDEWKELMSEKNSGEGNPMYGKTFSQESREKMSESHKGYKHTDETKEKFKNFKDRGKNLGKYYRPKQEWEPEQICIICGSKETYIINGQPKWCRHYNKEGHIDGWLCGECYGRIISSPRGHSRLKQNRKLRNDEYAEKVRNRKVRKPRITYLGDRIYMDEDPRTGYCQKCPNNIYDGTAAHTQLHHIEYIDEDPLEATFELCPSCHTVETWKQRKERENNK